MTIITKPLSEKKGDKLIVPLVENDQLASAQQSDDLESQNHNVVILRARARRVSTSTTLCLLLISLIVVGIGIVGGKYLYDQYISAQMHRFRGSANIPMYGDDSPHAMYMSNVDDNLAEDNDLRDSDLFQALSTNKDDDLNALIRRAFRESFDIDQTDDESYEKIDVPDFRYGRSGRFIHDFNTNITGIIDITGNRCFVMPLNRGNVLPPKSLIDLVRKMWEGYYKVDTQVIRATMRVVIPPLTDLKSVGTFISKECDGLPVYRLESYVGGVVKRSAVEPHDEVKFAQFSGKGITEFDIVNFDEVESFEKNNSH